MKPTLLAAIALVLAAPVAADTAPAYRVVVDQKGDAARTVEVRLDRRLDNIELSAIVNAIIDREPRAYPRTTVNFLLETTRPADGPWASATSLRETQIRVPGLTAEEERGYRADAASDRRNVIGSWLTSTPATPGRLTLYREHDRLMLDWQMRGSLARVSELAETPIPAGTRLDHIDGTFETHFILSRDGALEIHAKGTLITVAERISGERPLVLAHARDSSPRSTLVQPWPMPDGDFITSSLRDSAEPLPSQAGPAALPRPVPHKVSRRPSATSTAAAPAKPHSIDIAKVFYGQ